MNSRISQIVMFAIVVLGLLVMVTLFSQAGIKDITISALEQYISQAQVERVQLHLAVGQVRGEFQENSEAARQLGTRHFRTQYDPAHPEDLNTLLREHNVTTEVVNPSIW